MRRLFSRLLGRDTAATLVASMLDTDVDCSHWKREYGGIGGIWALCSRELGATVKRQYVSEKMSLLLNGSYMPLDWLDRGVLTQAHDAWVGRWREIERERLTGLTAAAIADAIKSGAVK